MDFLGSSSSWYRKVNSLFRTVISQFLFYPVDWNFRVGNVHLHGHMLINKVYHIVGDRHIVVHHSSVGAQHPTISCIARKVVVDEIASDQSYPSVSRDMDPVCLNSVDGIFASGGGPGTIGDSGELIEIVKYVNFVLGEGFIKKWSISIGLCFDLLF